MKRLNKLFFLLFISFISCKEINNEVQKDDPNSTTINYSELNFESIYEVKYYSSIEQWINYFDDQIKFYGKLPNQIANNVKVRLYPYDYEWSQYERWKEKFPNSKFDKCEKDFNNAISKCGHIPTNSTLYFFLP